MGIFEKDQSRDIAGKTEPKEKPPPRQSLRPSNKKSQKIVSSQYQKEDGRMFPSIATDIKIDTGTQQDLPLVPTPRRIIKKKKDCEEDAEFERK